MSASMRSRNVCNGVSSKYSMIRCFNRLRDFTYSDVRHSITSPTQRLSLLKKPIIVIVINKMKANFDSTFAINWKWNELLEIYLNGPFFVQWISHSFSMLTEPFIMKSIGFNSFRFLTRNSIRHNVDLCAD